MLTLRDSRSQATGKQTRSHISRSTPLADETSDLADVSKPDELSAVANCGLFRLPKELRLQIYLHLLRSPVFIQWPDDRTSRHLTPALLLTCRAIHEEATPALYASNTLVFQHPSDCNMFGWAHSPDSAKLVTRIALNIRDKDVQSLWTGYLSSTQPFRSLQADFPCLRDVQVTFKSTFWVQMGGTPEQKFQHWLTDDKMRDVAQALKEVRDTRGVMIRITAVHRVPAQDVRHLKLLRPTAMDPDQSHSEFRTGVYNVQGTWFLLVLLPITPL